MFPIFPLIQMWIHFDNGNPFIIKEQYALLNKIHYKFLDEELNMTNGIGHWVSNPEKLNKVKDAIIVSNKIASKDSKHSIELLSLFAFFNYKNINWKWKKSEAPDFILYNHNGEKIYAEVTSTTSKFTWKMRTNCFVKLSKKKKFSDSILIINKQIIKAINKKDNKISNYQNNTGIKKGILIIHLSSLSADIDKLIGKGIELNSILPPNISYFDEVFWLDGFGNCGILKNK